MRWIRRRRHNAGIFYWNTSRFIPTSWGVHVGAETFNVTRRTLWTRLPFGLGDLVAGGQRRSTNRRRR